MKAISKKHEANKGIKRILIMVIIVVVSIAIIVGTIIGVGRFYRTGYSHEVLAEIMRKSGANTILMVLRKVKTTR